MLCNWDTATTWAGGGASGRSARKFTGSVTPTKKLPAAAIKATINFLRRLHNRLIFATFFSPSHLARLILTLMRISQATLLFHLRNRILNPISTKDTTATNRSQERAIEKT
jgi:hypothetical protein